MEFSRVLLPALLTERELRAWFVDNQLKLHRISPADASTAQPFEITAVSADQTSGVHYIEDGVSNVPYFVVLGAERNALKERLEADFDTITLDTVLAEPDAKAADIERANRMTWVGLLASQLTQAQIEALLTAGLEDASPRVRKAAALATGYTGDRDWVPRLEHVAENDEDPGVRKEAGRLARGLAAHGAER